jgi:hypothetical protein
MWIILSVGSIIGYLTYSLGSAPEVGVPNRFDRWIGFQTSLKFRVGLKNNRRVVLHVHHWLYLWSILMMTEWLPIQAFCFGGMIQGLTYSDWYHVLYIEP